METSEGASHRREGLIILNEANLNASGLRTTFRIGLGEPTPRIAKSWRLN